MSAEPIGSAAGEPLPRELHLPLLLLSQYLFYLSRRPISESNLHYLDARLRGLQSLAPLLERSGNGVLDKVVAQLSHLHAAAFRRLGARVVVGRKTTTTRGHD